MNSKQLRWFYLILLSFIWGSSYILMKKALIGLTPIQVGTLRMIFTALTLFAFGYKSITGLTRKEWLECMPRESFDYGIVVQSDPSVEEYR